VSLDSVIVVGGGPTGFLCALGLARAGVDVTLLEAEAAIVPSPRAMVYYGDVLGGLERLGVLDDADRIGFRNIDLQMHVFATGERIRMNLQAMHAGTGEYGYNLHLGQHKLAGVAREHLRRHRNAHIHWSTRVTGLTQDETGVTLRTQKAEGAREFRAGWVIGADGARSVVRQALGLTFDGMTWPERFVATNIVFDFGAYGYAGATMQLDPVYGAIVARIDNDGLWRCTYSEDAALPEAQIEARMKDWFAAMLPGDQRYQLVQYSPYRMHQRCAKHMRVGRVLLAGDAAHVTNPTGGLGLTSGLFDLYVLHEALAAVIRGEADDQVLDLYAEERRRAFLEKASPKATEFKNQVYGCTDLAKLEEHLKGVRYIAAADPALQRRAFGVAGTLATPSVLNRHRAAGP
jgi:3-(3-hydroxy-phenyl)propionate hydroxylase